MATVMMGIFYILHALVHLLYAGQALRFFELRPGMVWPDGAWLFSKLWGNDRTRWLAAISLALTALGYAVGGLGLFLRQEWWRSLAVGRRPFRWRFFPCFGMAGCGIYPIKAGLGF